MMVLLLLRCSWSIAGLQGVNLLVVRCRARKESVPLELHPWGTKYLEVVRDFFPVVEGLNSLPFPPPQCPVDERRLPPPCQMRSL